MVVRGIQWLGVCAAEWDATVSFYRDVLGLAARNQGMQSDPRDAGVPFVELVAANGDFVEVFGRDLADREIFQVPMIGFLVDSVRAARTEMEAKGAVFLGPVGGGGQWEWSYFRTPEGHVHQLLGEIPRGERVRSERQVALAGGRKEQAASGMASADPAIVVAVDTPNLARAIRFYREALGFEVLQDRSPEFVLVALGHGTGLCLDQAPAGAPPPVSPRLIIAVTDVAARERDLRRAGVLVHERHADGPRPWISVLDPDGRPVVFLRGP